MSRKKYRKGATPYAKNTTGAVALRAAVFIAVIICAPDAKALNAFPAMLESVERYESPVAGYLGSGLRQGGAASVGDRNSIITTTEDMDETGQSRPGSVLPFDLRDYLASKVPTPPLLELVLQASNRDPIVPIWPAMPPVRSRSPPESPPPMIEGGDSAPTPTDSSDDEIPWWQRFWDVAIVRVAVKVILSFGNALLTYFMPKVRQTRLKKPWVGLVLSILMGCLTDVLLSELSTPLMLSLTLSIIGTKVILLLLLRWLS